VKQGASRHALADRKDDLYETPACATRALLRVEPCLREPRRIWEPCAGRGAIARELVSAGHSVEQMDLVPHEGANPGIVTPVDFLMEFSAPEGVEMIVTNPPYKLADAFIRHGLSLGLPVIVLLRLMALEGAGRSDLIDRHLSRVWAGIERLPTMHREGWEGKKIAVAGVPFAWFVFEQAHIGGSIELRRMSWREEKAAS
jgi:hypothetical protein